ncbi:hypothetical protein C0993_001659, partial [Termitomyces sp. T159_Od127]
PPKQQHPHGGHLSFTLNVLEDIDLCSLDRQALHGLDGKPLWLEEHNVAIAIPTNAVVRSP